MNTRAALGWAGFLLVGGIADVIADRRHNGSTLSECARATFGTDRRRGRVLFVACWAGLSAWLVPHICRR